MSVTTAFEFSIKEKLLRCFLFFSHKEEMEERFIFYVFLVENIALCKEENSDRLSKYVMN